MRRWPFLESSEKIIVFALVNQFTLGILSSLLRERSDQADRVDNMGISNVLADRSSKALRHRDDHHRSIFPKLEIIRKKSRE